jgi:hypothetical protein
MAERHLASANHRETSEFDGLVSSAMGFVLLCFAGFSPLRAARVYRFLTFFACLFVLHRYSLRKSRSFDFTVIRTFVNTRLTLDG